MEIPIAWSTSDSTVVSVETDALGQFGTLGALSNGRVAITAACPGRMPSTFTVEVVTGS